MSVVYDRFGVQVHEGDCLDVLRTMPDSSVHAVVTDPPYGLSEMPTRRVVAALSAWLSGDREHIPPGAGFMGRAWDSFVPPPAVWDECLRVLTPGGHLLAFAGTRTADLMGLSIRLAGFEIRDSIDSIGSRIVWVHGQGFPKRRDISRDIDLLAGAEREVVGTKLGRPGMAKDGSNQRSGVDAAFGGSGTGTLATDVTAPATDAARQWDGWHTALKPSHEPIIVARKPLTGTVAASVLEHGTGGLNVGACRVATTDNLNGGAYSAGGRSAPMAGDVREGAALGMFEPGRAAVGAYRQPVGRWPPNTVLSHVPLLDAGGEVIGDACADGCVDGCPVAELDRQSGIQPDTVTVRRNRRPDTEQNAHGIYGSRKRGPEPDRVYSGGGASRYFPCFRFEAKAPTAERPRVNGRSHSTVKPTALIRWLVRLVTPLHVPTQHCVSCGYDSQSLRRVQQRSNPETTAEADPMPALSGKDQGVGPCPQCGGDLQLTQRPGIVLDCFAGTGTTGQAARAEGFPAILIENDRDSIPYIVARLDAKPRTEAPAPDAAPVDPEGNLFDLLDDAP